MKDQVSVHDDMLAELPVAGALSAVAADPQLLNDAARLRENLSELIRVIQFRDRDRVCCYDVSVSQCYALEALVDEDGGTVNDLAARLYLDKSTASRLANGLEKKGYIRRVPNAEDGRSVLLQPTAKARKLVERIKWELAGEYVDMLADFDPAVRDSINAVAARLARAFASKVEVSAGSCCVVR
jgi:DNA-binding MarR family transcriptional regulator